MAELADAADSKSADLRVLGVRLPLPAPTQTTEKQWHTRLDDWMASGGVNVGRFSIDVFCQKPHHQVVF
jgi:hypothetical protein